MERLHNTPPGSSRRWRINVAIIGELDPRTFIIYASTKMGALSKLTHLSGLELDFANYHCVEVGYITKEGKLVLPDDEHIELVDKQYEFKRKGKTG